MQTLILELPTGDKVYHYQKGIVIFFNKGMRKVLSTSVYNGGYREDLSAVFNHDGTCGQGIGYQMLADNYIEHMRLVAVKLGLEPEKVSGMGTAAQMENFAACTMHYKELSVSAIVTAGIDVNGGRVGDPATYYQPYENTEKHGTINIFLVINADMPESSMARALVTCTEAKTAALQELLAGSNYSTGIATGSGTDQTMIVANPAAGIYQESAGKHSKLGELIGKTVMSATKEALFKQTGLGPLMQHSIISRSRRFGLNIDSLWQEYCSATDCPVIKPEFIKIYNQIDTTDFNVTQVSLYIHLLDQLQWQLLSTKETLVALQQILNTIADKYIVCAPNIQADKADKYESYIQALKMLLVRIVISQE